MLPQNEILGNTGDTVAYAGGGTGVHVPPQGGKKNEKKGGKGGKEGIA